MSSGDLNAREIVNPYTAVIDFVSATARPESDRGSSKSRERTEDDA